jgi:hypothetical protein
MTVQGDAGDPDLHWDDRVESVSYFDPSEPGRQAQYDRGGYGRDRDDDAKVFRISTGVGVRGF